MTSKRKRLRVLLQDHPDWTYKQYAEHLQQSEASIRGTLSAMGLSRGKKNTPDSAGPKPRSKFSKAKPRPPEYYVASKSTPSRFGYTKLM